jgi:hypothetical protein
MKKKGLRFAMLAALALFPSGVFCQSSPAANSNPEAGDNDTPATIVAGIVRTAQDVPVPGATVRVVHLASGRSWVGWTAGDGKFSFPGLPAGRYRLEVKQLGFGTSQTETDFAVGTAMEAQLTLHVDVSSTIAADTKPAEAQPAPANAATTAPERAKPAEESTSAVSKKKAKTTSAENGQPRLSRSKRGSKEQPLSAADAVPTDDASSSLGKVSSSDAYLVSGSVNRAESLDGLTKQAPTEATNFGVGIEKLWAQHRLSHLSSNRLHFSFHNRYDNSVWDARPYSLGGLSAHEVSHYDNSFGMSIAGPLYIPHVYDGRQRTFFFISDEFDRSNPLRDFFATVPTSSERNGDFSDRGVQLFDPTSSLTGPRTPLGSRIPDDRLDKAALGMLQFLPLPNLPGFVQNFHLQSVLPTTNNRFNVKILHTISPRLNLLASYNAKILNAQNPNSLPQLTSNTSGLGQAVTLGLTQNWTSRLINESRVNWSRNANNTLNGFAFKRNIVGELGIHGVSQVPSDWGVPLAHFTNFTDLNDVVPALHRNQTLRVVDNLTYSLAKHTIRIGAEIRWSQINKNSNPAPRGEFAFTGLMTSQLDTQGQPIANTGFDFADFLMGFAQSTTVRFGNPSTYFRSREYIAHVQDAWRVHPRFAVNLGIRYELATPPVEVFNRIADLVLNPDISAAALVTPGQINPFTGTRMARALMNTDPNNWAPRIGIALRPSSKLPTVLRAGYGISFNESIYNQLSLSMANQPPFAQSQNRQTTTATVLTLENGFPFQSSENIGNSVAVDPNYQVGYAQQWNVSVESRLKPSLVVDLTYTGTTGKHLDLLRAPNRATPGSPFSTDLRRRIPNAPGFTYETDGASSIYHALQLRVQRQMTQGLMVEGRYTFGKSIDDASSIGGGVPVVVQNDNNFRAERGLSSFDVRQQFRGSFSYELPFGPKKPWLHHGWLSSAFANLQVSGLTLISTGTPFTALLKGNAADNTGTGSNFSTRPDQIGSPNLSSDQRTPLHFFNTAAFALPPALQYGDAGRNTITGPGTFLTDYSLTKKLRFGEDGRVYTDVRWEVQNLTNTPNFVGLHTFVGSDLFGRVRSAKPMRNMDLMLRVSF